MKGPHEKHLICSSIKKVKAFVFYEKTKRKCSSKFNEVILILGWIFSGTQPGRLLLFPIDILIIFSS